MLKHIPFVPPGHLFRWIQQVWDGVEVMTFSNKLSTDADALGPSSRLWVKINQSLFILYTQNSSSGWLTWVRNTQMHWNFQHPRQSSLPTTAGTLVSTRRGDMAGREPKRLRSLRGGGQGSSPHWRTQEDSVGFLWTSIGRLSQVQGSLLAPNHLIVLMKTSSALKWGEEWAFFFFFGFPGIKNHLPKRETGDSGLIPRSGRSPRGGHGNPLQNSCLGNSTDRGAWWATESDRTVVISHACGHPHELLILFWLLCWTFWTLCSVFNTFSVCVLNTEQHRHQSGKRRNRPWRGEGGKGKWPTQDATWWEPH